MGFESAAEFVVDSLERNRAVFAALFAGVGPEERLWREAPEKWCLHEVLCHLFDEEREDFRARTRHALETPEANWPEIDPEGWVRSRNYLGWDFEETLANWQAERTASVAWLRSLGDFARVNWASAYVHPKYGPLAGSLFLANWLAHDDLHLRQIARLKHGFLREKSGVELRYAGAW